MKKAELHVVSPDTAFVLFYGEYHVNGITCMLTVRRKIETLLQ